MAKKRKAKDEQEDKAFKPPKFDEEKFLKKERKKIKTTFISFLFGLLIAIISFGFWTLLSGNSARWYLVLLFGIFTGSWLKYLFTKLKIDISNFGRKEWFSTYIVYFFSWLIILMVIINPPFHDEQNPRVVPVVLPDMQEPGGTVMVLAKITDNVGIKESGIDLSIKNPDGSTFSPDFIFKNNTLRYIHQSPENVTDDETYTYTITVKDKNDLVTQKTGSFKFSSEAINVPEPLGTNVYPGPKVGYATNIRIVVKPDVSRVYYKIDGSNEINATYDDGTFYKTSPIKEGWPNNGTIVTMKPYAEIIHYFTNSEEEFKNTIVDNNEYYFNVTEDPNIGTEEDKSIELPEPRFVKVPGFSTVLLFVAIILVSLMFKKYRKSKNK